MLSTDVFTRCIKELSGLHEDILTQSGDGDRNARRTTVNTLSQVQAENLEVIGREMMKHARERGTEIMVAMAKSKSVLTRTWPAACRSKNIDGMISLTTSSSDNRP